MLNRLFLIPSLITPHGVIWDSPKFDYTPAYANVTSGFASGHAFWQYERTQDQYPVGEIPMKLLVAVPNTYREKELTLRFDVRVRFSRSWWKRGMAVASYPTVVALP